MTKEFVQVRPDNGYLIHAVPASAEPMYHNQPRWSRHGAICGKIMTRDARRLPSLAFMFDLEKMRQGEFVRLPFTATMLQTADKAICITCAKRVAWASSH